MLRKGVLQIGVRLRDVVQIQIASRNAGDIRAVAAAVRHGEPDVGVRSVDIFAVYVDLTAVRAHRAVILQLGKRIHRDAAGGKDLNGAVVHHPAVRLDVDDAAVYEQHTAVRQREAGRDDELAALFNIQIEALRDVQIAGKGDLARKRILPPLRFGIRDGVAERLFLLRHIRRGDVRDGTRLEYAVRVQIHGIACVRTVHIHTAPDADRAVIRQRSASVHGKAAVGFDRQLHVLRNLQIAVDRDAAEYHDPVGFCGDGGADLFFRPDLRRPHEQSGVVAQRAALLNGYAESVHLRGAVVDECSLDNEF